MKQLQSTAAKVAHQLLSQCTVSQPRSEYNDTQPSNSTTSNSTRRGLKRTDESNIADYIEPIRTELTAIDAESFLTLDRVLDEQGATLQPGIKVRPIHDDIFPHLPGNQSASVRYIHIDEVPEQYSIGIFVFPPYAQIPLHDHPNMVVLSRILYGDVTVKSYDILHETASGCLLDPIDPLKKVTGATGTEYPNHNQNGKRWYSNIFPAVKEIFSSHTNKFRNESDTLSTSSGNRSHLSTPAPLRVIENASYSLTAPDVSVLFPHSGNVHEFRAGMYGAAILDCIFPPYDSDHERDCTFYIEEETMSHDRATIEETEDFKVNERKPCWLLPIQSPTDFHCITGRYRQLGANVDIDME